MGFEAIHYGGLGINVVGVLIGMERRLEDIIRVVVVGNHNVLIAAAISNGEAVGVVYV